MISGRKNGVSVIVCCYNSAQRLPKTIKHLAEQKVPNNIFWEVIVVDNASTDNTSGIARTEWDKYKLNTPFSVISQPKAGLSYAREKGIDASECNYCLFCDDDNWLCREYISIAYQILEERTNVGILGGKGEAVFEHREPTWFKKYRGFYAVGPQSTLAFASVKESRRHVYGAGMIIRKEVYQEIQKGGFKSILSGRKGYSLVSGEDTELCLAFALEGYDIFYDERLTFKHFIQKNRTSKNYLFKLTTSVSASWILLHPYLYALQGRSYQSHILLKDIAFLLLAITKACGSYLRCVLSQNDLFEVRTNLISRILALKNIVKNAKAYDRKLRLLLSGTI